MASKRTPTDIPVGTQFSPGVLDLPKFLNAVIANSGDKTRMIRAVWRRPVWLASLGATNRRGSLPLEAAAQYGLLFKGTYEATDLAKSLALLDDKNLYESFARHILNNLGGIRVVTAAQQMKADGLKVGADSLARYLTEQGFRVTEHNTAINSVRMWLERAGVFGAGGNKWAVDSVRKREVLGIDDEQIAALVGLSPEQKAYALALCRIKPVGRVEGASIRPTAELILGKGIARSSLPKVIYKDLKAAGLVDYETKGTSGGKSSLLWTLPAFDARVLEPFLQKAVANLSAALAAYYQRSLDEIYKDLASKDARQKGLALEAYAVHIMRLLGLRFIGWRKTGTDTGGTELDVLMTGVMGVIPTRWQIQCKNTPTGVVDVEDVAKEVGQLPVTKATHVMLLANCRFTSAARRWADKTMEDSSITIFLLDKEDFERVKERPGELPAILRDQADRISKLPRDASLWSST